MWNLEATNSKKSVFVQDTFFTFSSLTKFRGACYTWIIMESSA